MECQNTNGNRSHRTGDNARLITRVAVEAVIQEICRCIRSYFGFVCEPSLVGSVAENTKTFLPDEYDFVITITDNCEDQSLFKHRTGRKIAQMLHLFMLYQLEYQTIASGPDLKYVCLMRGAKISRARFKWSGDIYQDLDIFIDIIFAFCRLNMKDVVVAKQTRFCT